MRSKIPPTVCLDGEKVRRIREEKKLTQLYVAKVVGVTTDTISRWENNRYPSMKGENALRLAEALEVAVEEILREETGECPLPEPPPGIRWKIVGAALILIAAVVAGIYYFSVREPGIVDGIQAQRLLPPYAAPGTVIPVRVRLTAVGGMKGFILREHYPKGWKLIEAYPPASSLDNEEGMARWIVKPGETQPVVSYLLRVVSLGVPGEEKSFSGEVIVNPGGRSVTEPVEGADRVQVDLYHWADLNGDQTIDDGEVLLAFDIVEEMKKVHLDWDAVESIWDAGGYRWDEKRQRFVPKRPPHGEPPS